MERIPTWRDIPAEKLIRLLGEKGDGFHPRDICEPGWIAKEFDIPLELLPVEEILADEYVPRGRREHGERAEGNLGRSAWSVLRRNGKPIPYMQGVIAGDLIDSIAKGLGVRWPDDARTGYSGGRFDLAFAVVKHLKSESKPKTA